MTNEEIYAFDNVDKIKIEENYHSYIYCKACKDIPEFTFENFPIINVKCDNDKVNHKHNGINNINKEEYIKNIDEINSHFNHMLKGEINNQRDNFKKFEISDLPPESRKDLKEIKLICSKHESSFKYYCKNCGKHQCKNCRFEDLSNDECKHENCEDFTQKECDISQKKEDIKKLFESLNDNDKSFDDENFMKYLKNSSYIEKFHSFIEHLFNHYEKFKHETIIKNISNLYDFLFKSRNKKKEELEINKIDVVSSPFILNHDDLNSKKIVQIKISSFCINMAIFGKFKEDDFPNLVKLSLKNNNISDISVLTHIQFSSLEKLNLNSNNLGNDMIDNIKNIQAQNLKSLNLCFNYFTEFRLFEAVEHFENLEIFKMETNPFDEGVDINKINKIYKFLSLKKLYLFNGIFCNETIGLLKKFKFKNLEVLDISSNNLKSLDFLIELDFVDENNNKLGEKNIPLKEIYLNNGDITENEIEGKKDSFKKYTNLEKIGLRNNSITNTDCLNSITDFFTKNNKKLVIDLTENPIKNLNDPNLRNFFRK